MIKVDNVKLNNYTPVIYSRANKSNGYTPVIYSKTSDNISNMSFKANKDNAQNWTEETFKQYYENCLKQANSNGAMTKNPIVASGQKIGEMFKLLGKSDENDYKRIQESIKTLNVYA